MTYKQFSRKKKNVSPENWADVYNCCRTLYLGMGVAKWRYTTCPLLYFHGWQLITVNHIVWLDIQMVKGIWFCISSICKIYHLRKKYMYFFFLPFKKKIYVFKRPLVLPLCRKSQENLGHKLCSTALGILWGCTSFVTASLPWGHIYQRLLERNRLIQYLRSFP